MKALLVIVFFFLLGAFFIITNNNLHLNNSEELRAFSTHYIGWFEKLFSNGKQVTGYVIHSNWLPSDKP
jgi:hypothetical protein